MRRIVAALVPAVVGMAASGWAIRADADDGPELLPPSVVGPVGTPPGELPGAIEATPMPRPGGGSVLVVPGVTAPRSAPRARSAGPRVESATPPLVGPSEMREPAPPSRPTPSRPSAPRDLNARPPLTLESIPADELKGGGLAPPTARRTLPPSPRNAPPLWRRPGGLLSRFGPSVAIDRRGNDNRDAVKVEPGPGPDQTADAALKRQVERQIRDTLGSRLRSYEVRINGGDIKVVARPARFWQRRSVKGALEALPALRGARVEVID